MTRIPECVESLKRLLHNAGLEELRLEIITARSAVRIIGRDLLVRASAVADASRLPTATTHIFAIGRDADTIYCIADTYETHGAPCARLQKTLHPVRCLDEDAWIANTPPQSEIQRQFLDDLFRHAHWWDDQ